MENVFFSNLLYPLMAICYTYEKDVSFLFICYIPLVKYSYSEHFQNTQCLAWAMIKYSSSLVIFLVAVYFISMCKVLTDTIHVRRCTIVFALY